HDRLLREPNTRVMDFTGRPMKGYLYVSADGLTSDATLERWIGHGVAYTTGLPAKAPRGGKVRPKPRKTKLGRRKLAPRARRARAWSVVPCPGHETARGPGRRRRGGHAGGGARDRLPARRGRGDRLLHRPQRARPAGHAGTAGDDRGDRGGGECVRR